MKKSSLVVLSLVLASAAGCPATTGGDGPGLSDDGIRLETTHGSDDSGDTTSAPPPDETADSSTTGSTSSPFPDDSSSGDPEPPADSSGSDDSSSGTAQPDTPLDCGGTVYSCTDGVDNDGDGLVDLDDPECTGPCDDDELTFQTGIPGDNMDCKQDCFFDGNSGQGDDGCDWNLRCDPENPGAQIGCEYTGGNSCNNVDPPSEECLMACQPLVPPGCDCFGCCTVNTDAGPVSIFLNSGPDCSLDNLEACGQCTPQDDVCGNTCDAEDCELCFGETELPPGCEQQQCDVGTVCQEHTDCGPSEFCFLGCCFPEPAG